MDDTNDQPAKRPRCDVLGHLEVLVAAACGPGGQTAAPTEPPAHANPSADTYVYGHDEQL